MYLMYYASSVRLQVLIYGPSFNPSYGGPDIREPVDSPNCNSLLIGTAKRDLHTFSGKSNNKNPNYQHTTSKLCSLHWLSTEQRIQLKIHLPDHKTLHSTQLIYLCSLITLIPANVALDQMIL